MTATEEPVFERLWHDITRRPHPSTIATSNHQGGTMSLLTEIHNALDEGLGNLEGWADSIKSRLPEVAALAAKYEGNPIVAELEKLGDLVLPPEVITGITGLIQMGGKIASAAAAAASDTAAPAQAADAQPAGTAPAT
ncbi:MAG: hypothetical protein ACRDOL_22625 [Streptosporangiaceae bacterium]